MDGAGKPMEPADGSPLSSLLRSGSQKVAARASDSLVAVELSKVVHPLFSKCVEYRRLFPSSPQASHAYPGDAQFAGSWRRRARAYGNAAFELRQCRGVTALALVS
jgi:hypothetical protein